MKEKGERGFRYARLDRLLSEKRTRAYLNSECNKRGSAKILRTLLGQSKKNLYWAFFAK